MDINIDDEKMLHKKFKTTTNATRGLTKHYQCFGNLRSMTRGKIKAHDHGLSL
jgi:hypothetical protein